MLLLCLLDWGALDRTLFAPRPAQVVLAEGDQLAKYLASQPGHFRVYSPSYSLPQQTAAYYHVELADGVDPLQLQSYVSFMQSASGVPSNGYSVTLPPFAEPAEARPSTSSGGVPTAEPAEARPSTSSGDAPTAEPVEAGSVEAPPSTSSGGVPTAEPAEARPSTSSGSDPARANAAYRPDPRLLGLLNVRYVAAEFDLPVEGLVLRSRWGETRLYENLAARPRAWIRLESGKPVGLPVGLDEEDNYEDWRWLPNSIEGYVEGPGLLILSEMMYPGWRATIDGRPVQIETDHGLLRTVLLQAGRQYFRMYYQPDSVLSGLAICVDTLILLAILFGIKRRGRRQGRSGGAKGLVSQA
jgi:hypothetical protein